MKKSRLSPADTGQAAYWPWIALFFTVLILYLRVSVRVEDDVWFASVFFGQLDGDLFGFLAFRYQTWSTRLILEGLMMPLLRYAALYKLAIAAWITLIGIATAKLLRLETPWQKLAVGAALLLLPMSINTRAGYVCTTINYIFTICCFLWAIMPTVMRARGKKLPLWADAGSFLLMIIACNMEFYCIPFLLLALTLLIWTARNKRLDWRCLVLALIAFGSGLFSALSPTNTITAYAETAASTFFAGYDLLTFAEKLIININSTSGGLISAYQYGDSFIIGALTLGVLFALYGFFRVRGKEKAVWFFPLAVTLFIGVPARLVPVDSFFGKLFMAPSSGWAAPVPGQAAPWALPLCIAILFFTAFLWCCFRLDVWLGAFSSAALVSRLSMLSASVYSSGMRTFYLLLFAICAAAALTAARLGGSEKARKPAAAVLSLGALWALISNVISIFI